jgi:HSP20 family protein
MAQEIKKPEPQKAVAPRYADPFTEMRMEMDRLFDSFLGRGFGGAMPALFKGEPRDGMMVPTMDIKETPNELVVEAELPGLEDKDVNVSLRDGVLTIKGEKKSEREEKQQDYHLTERSYGKFERSFRLPDTIDEDNIAAMFEKGVLKVTMPKRPDVAKAEKSIPIGGKG